MDKFFVLVVFLLSAKVQNTINSETKIRQIKIDNEHSTDLKCPVQTFDGGTIHRYSESESYDMGQVTEPLWASAYLTIK